MSRKSQLNLYKTLRILLRFAWRNRRFFDVETYGSRCGNIGLGQGKHRKCNSEFLIEALCFFICGEEERSILKESIYIIVINCFVSVWYLLHLPLNMIK